MELLKPNAVKSLKSLSLSSFFCFYLPLSPCAFVSFSFYLSLDHLFVSDWRTESVYRMRKRDGGDNIVLRKGILGVMNVKAYSADLQGCESEGGWGSGFGLIHLYMHSFSLNQVTCFTSVHHMCVHMLMFPIVSSICICVWLSY